MSTDFKLYEDVKEMTSDESPPSIVLPDPDHENQFSPIGSPAADFPFTFPEVFRQAIQEVDIMTKNCSPTPNTDVSSTCKNVASRQELIITPLTDKKPDETLVSSDKRCCGAMNKKSVLTGHVRWRQNTVVMKKETKLLNIIAVNFFGVRLFRRN